MKAVNISENKNSKEMKPCQEVAVGPACGKSLNRLRYGLKVSVFWKVEKEKLDTTNYQRSGQNKQRAMPQNRGRKRR